MSISIRQIMLSATLMLGLVSAMSTTQAQDLSEETKQAIAERITLVGKVCLEGEPCAANASAVVVASGEPRSGDAVYNASCMACHGTGAAGAPKYGDVAAWTPRISKGLETLYSHAINGFNGMPAKGACATCSDDEIKAAVKYMVDGSK